MSVRHNDLHKHDDRMAGCYEVIKLSVKSPEHC